MVTIRFLITRVNLFFFFFHNCSAIRYFYCCRIFRWYKKNNNNKIEIKITKIFSRVFINIQDWNLKISPNTFYMTHGDSGIEYFWRTASSVFKTTYLSIDINEHYKYNAYPVVYKFVGRIRKKNFLFLKACKNPRWLMPMILNGKKLRKNRNLLTTFRCEMFTDYELE